MGISIVSPVSETIRFACRRSPRVALLTDASSSDLIPESVRTIADEVHCGDLSWIGRSEIPKASDGAVIWCKGDSLAGGSPADWRRPFFSEVNSNTFVVVHWPYLEHADLVGFEPRLLRPNAKQTVWNPALGIDGSTPSEKRKTAWRAANQPWSRLSLAIWMELEKPTSSIDSLAELWRSSGKDQQFAPLVLRNLIVVLLKSKNWPKAGELLDLGIKAFPSCAEFQYLQAVYFILQESPSKAVRFLEAALDFRGNGYIGSGGENSYRASYLLGMICDSVGQQEKAVHYWLAGAAARPAFGPSIRALTCQHLPRGQARWLHHPLAEMARREPQYLEFVVDFLTTNDLALAGRRLAETVAIDAVRREGLLNVIERAERRATSRSRTPQVKPGILLTGPIFDASGHGRINRAIAQALINAPQFETALEPTNWPTISRWMLKDGERLWNSTKRKLESVDLTIRHQWPPDFSRPASGKLACILPWEHKAVPMRWIEQIDAKVDELWAPSEFTRSAFVAAGLSADRVHVIPNAVDPEVFKPDGPETRPLNAKGFIFLFVGGLISRKGIDLVLQAYADTFTPEEDVTLVIKDVGSRSFYGHNTKLADVQRFAGRRTSPHTLVLTEEMEDATLAALYRGADAFVLPYRGEGFGMPLIEAMACGKPIITTAEGPAAEFCPDQEGYLIPARSVEVREAPPPLGPLSSEWTWFEPDVPALASTMRHVYENRDEAAIRGKKAAGTAATRFTWTRILPIYLERIHRLLPIDVSIPQDL